MPAKKDTKKAACKKPNVIYLGTSEAVAKVAPHKGIMPYAMPQGSDHYDADNRAEFLYLSSVYPGFFAFDTTLNSMHRWGVVEIDLGMLNQSNFLPYEGYLVDRSRKKIQDKSHRLKLMANYRKNLGNHREKWKASLQECGVCLHVGQIPVNAIRKVSIYDPFSNEFTTNNILNTVIATVKHKENYRRNELLTRWLAAEAVELEEWLGKDLVSTPNDDRINISMSLMNKHGLDVFFASTR